nr:uncharacterized protein LOC102067157 [Zonotrichia albicollis]
MKDSTSCSKAGFFSPIVDGWMCCPKGWRRFQGSCYFLSTDTMNCAESARNCTGMGSQLVVITSKTEQVSAQGPRERDPAGRATVLGPGGDSEPSLSCRGGERSCLHLCSTSPLCHQPHIMGIPDASVCSVLPLMDIVLFFQEFLFNLTKEKATSLYETKYYIGLAAYKTGKWQWVDQTPYESTAT